MPAHSRRVSLTHALGGRVRMLTTCLAHVKAYNAGAQPAHAYRTSRKLLVLQLSSVMQRNGMKNKLLLLHSSAIS